jgi:hypothetical protein
MINKTKNLLISFLAAYLIIDISGVVLLNKKYPVCVKMFAGDFKNKHHWLIFIFALVLGYFCYKYLEKKDEN